MTCQRPPGTRYIAELDGRIWCRCRCTPRRYIDMGLNVQCLCQTSPKPSTGRILDYVAQNRIPRAPSPPATPHFLWFPTLGITQRDA